MVFKTSFFSLPQVLKTSIPFQKQTTSAPFQKTSPSSQKPHSKKKGQYDEEVTFSGKLEDVASAVNILNDAFRIYYSDQPVEDQQRAQIEAARRGDNYHTCKEGGKGSVSGKRGRCFW